jgi:DNA-binding NarL/FixJ family response regulator
VTASRYETLKGVSRGLCNAQIADEQGIPLETVKSQLKFWFGHFGAANRTHLAAICYRERIV